MESISKKINIALAKREMNKLQLCSKINVASGNLSNMMARDNYKTDTLEKIANALDCDLKILFIDRDTGEEL